ncbi:ribonuclease III family protein [Blattabacterium cuenoti]|uniref:Ribonuclease 3 n=1 Tax=Blattabacterium cuenoti STAT TaxID=1457030 RepID=A0A224AKN1_9FLAO|nr:ribonuclease III domain-containing protein [Blattabacterium cuenoti]BBA17462.1 ribonuclease III [Blattabacterium cuenoti STAT]
MLSENRIFFEKNDSSVLVGILIKILGFCPKNTKFLKEVFIYSFYTKKRNFNQNYSLNFQRLEFLGDAILNSIISYFLCEKFPEKKEGELTQIRSKIVCRRNLNKISRKLTISDIFFDKSMISENILGNTLEALIGFIFLDGGYQKCENFVYKKILHPHVNIEKLQNEIFSYKVWILEWSQKNKFFINFKTFREDQNQRKIIYLSEFTISECGIQTQGTGSSKKKSEEMAAKEAYFIVQRQYKINFKTDQK